MFDSSTLTCKQCPKIQTIKNRKNTKKLTDLKFQWSSIGLGIIFIFTNSISEAVRIQVALKNQIRSILLQNKSIVSSKIFGSIQTLMRLQNLVKTMEDQKKHNKTPWLLIQSRIEPRTCWLIQWVMQCTKTSYRCRISWSLYKRTYPSPTQFTPTGTLYTTGLIYAIW